MKEMNLNILSLLTNKAKEEKFVDFKNLVINEINILENDTEDSKSLKDLKVTLFEIQAFNIVSDYYEDLNLTRVIYIKDIDKRQQVIKRILDNCDDRNKLRAIIMEVLLTYN